MTNRFCTYLDKVFDFSSLFDRVRDGRVRPKIPAATVFACVFTLQATRRGSLNAWEHDPLRLPRAWHQRLNQLETVAAAAAGTKPPQTGQCTIPSPDTLARVYSRIDSRSLRDVLGQVVQQLGRNKVLRHERPLTFVALDGHEFFSSRKRCCKHCLQRQVTIGSGPDKQQVTEYYHRGVMAQLVGPDIAVPLDVELQAPGEGEVAAAQRLLTRICQQHPRLFDAVLADALYFEAPFINFCRGLKLDVLVVVKGEQRLLLQDAQGLFAAQPPSATWLDQKKGERRTIQAWDAAGFTSCEGVVEPLRVLHTHETIRSRERVAGQWQEKTTESNWWWATTISAARLPTRSACQAGHGRWQVENEGFNVLSTHWGLDHVYTHDATALVNFTLTLMLVYMLLQCFFRRNLKPAARKAVATLIALAAWLYQSWLTPGLPPSRSQRPPPS
jgi:hypothetical protein